MTPPCGTESRDEMLEHARRVVAAAEAEAPQWFAVVPDEPCAVEPVPEAEEAGMAPAYYMPGAIDGSRAGHLLPEHVQARRAAPLRRRGHRVPRGRARTSLPTDHRDGVQEPRRRPGGCCTTLPAPRDGASTASGSPTRWGSTATTSPGWASSSADSWRASRLVVDTGLHAHGLDRVNRPSTGWPAHAATPDGDRVRGRPLYLVPGSGPRLHGRPARSSSACAPWPRLPLVRTSTCRQFHDLVLRAGILPLPALARTVERWVDRWDLLVGTAEGRAAGGARQRCQAGTAPRAVARATRTTPKRQTAVTCMAVHHRQIAPIRKSST